MGKFIALWAAFLASVLGSTFTGLALGVWVFQQTGSAAMFGLTLVANLLPGIVLSPVAGTFAERWSRRGVLLVSNGINAVTVLALAAVFWAGGLEPWHVFIGIGVQSVVRALTGPALGAAVVALAPEDWGGRANGMVIGVQTVAGTVGFAAGGVLILAIGLGGVLLIDAAAFVCCLLVVLCVSIPQPPEPADEQAPAGRPLDGIREGWRYLTARRGLAVVLAFYTSMGFVAAYADVLLTPLVLSFGTARDLGIVMGCAGVGAVLGSLAMSSWGGPRRRVHGIAGFGLLMGVFLCLGGLRPSVVLVVVAAFGFALATTVADGTARRTIELQIEPGMHGRVFGTFNMMSSGAECISYALAGFVADQLFEPLLREGGSLTGSVGAVIGVGEGRGTAMLVIVVGIAVLAVAAFFYLRADMRNLPDKPTGDGAGDEPALAPARTEP